MALLTNKKVAVSTLQVVIVASVLWLLFFFLSLNILVQVGTSRTDQSHLLLAEVELQACRTEALLLPENETVVRNYEWGEIQIHKERYGDAIVRIRLKAIVGKEQTEIHYTYLVKEEQQ